VVKARVTAGGLQGYQTAADRTPDSVFQTARTITRSLKDPHITA
jgi:hypothetical protein